LDFVQIVWKSFFAARDNSNRFERPEELVAYLATMARNKVGMETRRRLASQKFNVRNEQCLGQQGCDDLSSQCPAPFDVAVAHERWENMLKDQPPHYRRIIQMRLQGYSFQDIGKSVHLDERTVRRFLQKLLQTTST
jgi:DNA-directed RNA polymerase specialized sigma24 family protein